LTGANRVYATGLFKAVRYALEDWIFPGYQACRGRSCNRRLRRRAQPSKSKGFPVKLALTVSALIGFFGRRYTRGLHSSCARRRSIAHRPNPSCGKFRSAGQIRFCGHRHLTLTARSGFRQVDQKPSQATRQPSLSRRTQRKDMGGEASPLWWMSRGMCSDVKPFPFKDQRTERTVDIGGEKVTLTETRDSTKHRPLPCGNGRSRRA